MKAVLPYIDDFLPVHNLASLQQRKGGVEQGALNGRRDSVVVCVWLRCSH